MKLKLLLLFTIVSVLEGIANAQEKEIGSGTARFIPEAYVPASIDLYGKIRKLDSIYFETYNNCKLDQMDSLTAENIEFYHDRSGLSTSKKELRASVAKYICGKVTRRLIPESLEVYEIPGYGAIEFGYHTFRSVEEPGESKPGKFVIVWRNQNDLWQITRVISLH